MTHIQILRDSPIFQWGIKIKDYKTQITKPKYTN